MFECHDSMGEKPRNSKWGGLSTADLLIMVACFVKKKIILSISKAADLNWLVQGGLLYLAYPFSKGSLDKECIFHQEQIICLLSDKMFQNKLPRYITENFFILV